MSSLSIPAECFAAETLAIEFQSIQPPDFWTTVRDAQWADYPQFVGPASDRVANPMIYESQEAHSVRLWSPLRGKGTYKEENNVELDIATLVLIAWVVRSGVNLARELFMARADITNLLESNRERNRPGYTGANDWGLTTTLDQDMRTEFLMPGLAIIWAECVVETAFHLPKG